MEGAAIQLTAAIESEAQRAVLRPTRRMFHPGPVCLMTKH
jgi:hypothetical protein